MNRIFLINALLLFPAKIFAQENAVQEVKNPPIVLEILPGTNGYAAQMTVNKSFRNFHKFGIFSVTNFSSKWRETYSKDMMNQIHLTYQFAKGFKMLAGTHYTPHSGLRPNTAVLYTYSSKTILFSMMPRIDLSKHSNWEGFALFEYKPQINQQWDIYTRAQGLYCAGMKNGDHARSYLMLRAGLSYKDFRFGLGANWDAYGPNKTSKENYGIFIASNVFN